jgi:microcystin-dependent protein
MEPFIGTIQLFPYSYAPKGWMRCEGQALSIQQYSTLFSLIGTRFGGDGRTNFKLPDMRGKEPIPETSYCIAIDGIYPPR